MKVGVWRCDFFLNHLDWLRGRAKLGLEKNPSSRSASKKFTFHSPPARCQGQAFLDQLPIFKPVSLAKDLYQVLKSKKIGTWDAPDIGTLRVERQPFRIYDTSTGLLGTLQTSNIPS